MLKSDRGVLVFACRVYGRACHWCVSGRGAQWRGGVRGGGGRGGAARVSSVRKRASSAVEGRGRGLGAGAGSARVIGARAGEQRGGGGGGED